MMGIAFATNSYHVCTLKIAKVFQNRKGRQIIVRVKVLRIFILDSFALEIGM